MTALGKHTLLEFYDCDLPVLNRYEFVRTAMLEAAHVGKATIVKDVFHQFSPQGVSGVVVIAESHLAIHTWPEHRYAAVDLFTCSPKIDALAIELHLRSQFGSRRVEKTEIDRGSRVNLKSGLGIPSIS